MCGRFSLTVGDRDIAEEWGINLPFDYRGRYNIAPTQPVLTLVRNGSRADGISAEPDQSQAHIEAMHWGLVPSWAKDLKIGQKLINARAETIFEKPAFRAAARRRRCLVLADGFYEWQKTADGKQPVYIHLSDRKVFGFAGLWELWTHPGGDQLASCTIVTTEANEKLKPIHGRMPVIVPKALESLWLDRTNEKPDPLEPILKPYPADALEIYPVSKLVNSPANDLPACVERA